MLATLKPQNAICLKQDQLKLANSIARTEYPSCRNKKLDELLFFFEQNKIKSLNLRSQGELTMLLRALTYTSTEQVNSIATQVVENPHKLITNNSEKLAQNYLDQPGSYPKLAPETIRNLEDVLALLKAVYIADTLSYCDDQDYIQNVAATQDPVWTEILPEIEWKGSLLRDENDNCWLLCINTPTNEILYLKTSRKQLQLPENSQQSALIDIFMKTKLAQTNRWSTIDYSQNFDLPLHKQINIYHVQPSDIHATLAPPTLQLLETLPLQKDLLKKYQKTPLIEKLEQNSDKKLLITVEPSIPRQIADQEKFYYLHFYHNKKIMEFSTERKSAIKWRKKEIEYADQDSGTFCGTRKTFMKEASKLLVVNNKLNIIFLNLTQASPKYQQLQNVGQITQLLQTAYYGEQKPLLINQNKTIHHGR